MQLQEKAFGYSLSIIVPFYNSFGKCESLLDTLSGVSNLEIELVLIDDGSTDNTAEILEQFSKEVSACVKIIKQSNKGPGGARNAGLLASCGKYIWFVDSDDDICLSAIDILNGLGEDFDFIDFNYLQNGEVLDSMQLAPGVYEGPALVQGILLNRFGLHWTKIFLREFLVSHNIRYPEYCVYEDTALIGYILPRYAAKFLKVTEVAYKYDTSQPSVTRNLTSLRVTEIIPVAEFGMVRFEDWQSIKNYKNVLSTKWFRYSISECMVPLILSKRFFLWFTAARCIQHHRRLSREWNIPYEFWSRLSGGRKFKSVVFFLFIFSYMIPYNRDYFENLRYSHWGGEM